MEPKFRAWDIAEKCWVVIDDEDCTYFRHKGKVITFTRGGIILEQFTGLHDKNGKEIFEGDIMTRGAGWGNEVVQYYKCGFVRHNYKDDADYNLGGCDYSSDGKKDNEDKPIQLITEIIGNIHESPELMGEK